MPLMKYRSFLYNVLLFLPKRILQTKPYVQNSYRLRYLQQIFLLKKKDLIKDLYIEDNIKLKILFEERRIINKILNIGKILLKDLKLAIINKEALIKKLELLNKTEAVNYLNKNTVVENKNNALINYDFVEKENKLVLQEIKEKNLLSNKELFSSLLSKENNLEIISTKILNKTESQIGEEEITKNNKINIEQSIKNISKNTSFLSKKESIAPQTGLSNPVSLFYYSNNTNKQGETQDNLLVNIENKPILNLYLKEMSIYNMISKGIFINYYNIIGYNFNKNNLYKNIYNLLAASFKSMYCLISKPVFIITPDKVIIQLFYYLFIPNILKLKKFYKYNTNKKMFKGRDWFNRKKKLKKQYSKFRKIKLNVRIKLRNLSNITLTKIFSNKFRNLSLILNKFFKKPVEFDLIRLHYPYNDSNILVNLLGIMINKIKLRIIIRRLFEKAVIKNLNKLNSNNVNIIPAFLSGITIRVAGRLLTHRVVPRQTVKTTRRGASAKGKINFKDVASYTNKNKRGAFSITVKSGQNFF
uniref:Small ribosomal subunit protein uS3m n=1 Tax=Lyophyllum decastes TaxID=64660 RepID=A0A2Z4HH90_LYODE|nr:ribosomal protein S3 [Lyophyllum decastes]AWW14093.1 ribosomal protein S3 [Lyophyllum decastes]